MNNTILKKQDLYKDGALLPLGQIAERLVLKTSLRHSFVLGDCLWVYEPQKGIYERMPDKALEGYLLKTFEQVGGVKFFTRAMVHNLSWNIMVKIRTDAQGKAIDYDFITFRNGHLNLKTLQLEPLSPDIRSVTFIDALYDPKASKAAQISWPKRD